MILCDFCDERAVSAFASTGIVWAECPELVRFCLPHLRAYYLGLHYAMTAE